MKNTPLKAIQPLTSAWASASAGTGKTRLLTNRVLRLLLEDTPPEKILCLTFTKAAAAEMKHRIFNKLSDWATASDTELMKELQILLESSPTPSILDTARRLFLYVLDSPEGIRIETIHAFCQSLLKRFPIEANILPHSTIISDKEKQLLLEEIRINLLKNKHNDPELNQALRTIAWRFHDNSFLSFLHNLIESNRKAITLVSEQDTNILINKTFSKLNASPTKTVESLIEDFCSFSKSQHQVLKNAVITLQSGGKKDKNLAENIAKWLQAHAKERVDLFHSYIHCFLTQKNEPRKQLMSKALTESHPHDFQTLLNEQERIIIALDDIKSQHVATLTKALLIIIQTIVKEYDAIKNNQGMLDYDDLIEHTTALLHKSDASMWILYKLDGGIDHILVDEAQDTSQQQWNIIQALTEDFFSGASSTDILRSIFVVGDEKQSIYSFQGAEPRLFHLMQSAYADKVTKANKHWSNVRLEKSYRSTEPILTLVDTLFSNSELKKAISFSAPNIKHDVHRKDSPGKIQIWELEKQEKKQSEDNIWPLPIQQEKINDPQITLAEKIGDTIKTWLDSKQFLASKNRAIQPSDIMILVRRRGEFVHHIIRALKQRSIPVAGIDRMRLTEHLAIQDLIAIGNTLLLPDDDLTLATLLKSPLIGLNEEQLFTLCYGRNEKSLWASLFEKQNEHPKYKNAFSILQDLMKKAQILPLFELYSYILESLKLRTKLIQEQGDEVNDPINEFLTLITEYEKSHPSCLQGFIHWLSQGTLEVKRDPEHSSNEIRIMTIHASKGLQAPIVFLPDTTQLPINRSQFLWINENEDTPLMFWSPDALMEPHYCKTIKQRSHLLEMEEYYRLLYVAITRPEDELYICGWEQRNSLSEKSWYHLLLQSIKKLVGQEATLPLTYTNIEKDQYNQSQETFQDIKQTTPLPQIFLEPIDQMLQKDNDAPNEHTTEFTQSIAHFDQIAKGIAAHKLLELLPEIETHMRRQAAERYIEGYKETIKDTKTRSNIVDSVMQILEDEKYAFLFSKQSKAEVPIIGKINNSPVLGQIDRLVFHKGDIWIIDYKTGTPQPTIPKTYQKQLTTYKTLLENIFPNSKIHAAILWTMNQSIIHLSAEEEETIKRTA